MLMTFVSFQKIFDSHLQQFKDLFGRLRNVDLTLNPTKWNFAAKEVKYLEYLISKQDIQVDPNKTLLIRFLFLQKIKDITSLF